MSERHIDLAQVDSDGAVREAASAVTANPELREAAAKGDTRAQLLRKAAMGGGALAGGGLLLGGLSGTALGADSRSAKQDTAILNFALTLEYLEADFYRRAAKLGLSSEARMIARDFGDETAADPSAFFRKSTCAASCPATISAKVFISPVRALPATAWR